MAWLRSVLAWGWALGGLASAEVLAQPVVSSADYPSQALRQGHEGTVTFRVLVDEQGKPAGCAIVESSGWPELDVTTCELVMRRARFEPAKDEVGKPVKGVWQSKFRWVIPRDHPEAPPASSPAS